MKKTKKDYFSYNRIDEKGREVEVTLGKSKGELFFIRICTYGPGELRHRADFYKEHTPELFQRILEKEIKMKSFPYADVKCL